MIFLRTKTPTETKRSAGNNLLRLFWAESELSKNPIYKTGASFEGLRKIWDDENSNAIEWLGELAISPDSGYSYDDIENIVVDFAKNNNSYITPSNVSSAIIDKNSSKGFLDYAGTAVSETASDIGSSLVFFSRVGLVLAIGFFLFIGWIYFKNFTSAIKK